MITSSAGHAQSQTFTVALMISYSAKSSSPETGLILLLLRFLRRWNQSGQKHSGAPDIATTFFRAEPSVLLVLILGTFGDLLPQLMLQSMRSAGFSTLIAAFGSAALCASCIVFKAMFTVNDSPELWGQHAPAVLALSERLPSLVTLARIVFGGAALLIIALVFRRLQQPSGTPNGSGMISLCSTFPRLESRPLGLL